MTESAGLRAARGCALLDGRGPEGWAGLVDLSKFKLYNQQFCVLAQVFGRYGVGLRALGVVPAGPGEGSGFLTTFDHGFDGYGQDATELDAAWRAGISERAVVR